MREGVPVRRGSGCEESKQAAGAVQKTKEGRRERAIKYRPVGRAKKVRPARAGNKIRAV